MNKHLVRMINDEWKIDYRSDGLCFIGMPLDNKENRLGYVIAGMDKEMAEWILDAVKAKQEIDRKILIDR